MSVVLPRRPPGGGVPQEGVPERVLLITPVTKFSSRYAPPLLYMFLSFILSQPYSLQSDGSEVLLSPEVTCGPPDMIVTTPFALTIPHCADVSSEHWNIHLKKRTQQGNWEVRPESLP